MIMRSVTPVKNQYAMNCVFSTGQPLTRGGQRKKAKKNKQNFKNLLKIRLHEESSPVRRAQTRKIVCMVELEKIYWSEATDIRNIELKNI